MNIRIADASIKDVDNLIGIYSSPHLYHNREEASWFVKSFFDYHHIKVVKDEEEAVGAAFWNVVEEKHHGIAEILDIWIDEGFRGRGLGERLLRTVIEDMKQFFGKDSHTLRKVLVTTGEDNEPAKNLYEKVGFQSSAAIADLFGQGETERIYVLTLNP